MKLGFLKSGMCAIYGSVENAAGISRSLLHKR